MRSIWIGVIAGALVFFVAIDPCRAGAPQQPPGKHQAEIAALLGDKGSSAIVLPAGATVLRDLAYGNDPLQRIDVYLPKKTADGPKNAPVLFMLHGGAWFLGDKTNDVVVQNKIARWLPKGFIFVSVNYPMLPKTRAQAQIDHVARALAFAQAHAKAWGGDPAKFILMGHSAGGYLVTMLAASPKRAYGLGARPWLGTISLDSVALDVEKTMENPHNDFYGWAFGRDRAQWRPASPIDALSEGAMPILVICSLPRQGSCQDAAEFAAKAKKIGVRCPILRQDISHGEVSAFLGLPGAYTDHVEEFMASLSPSLSVALGKRPGK